MILKRLMLIALIAFGLNYLWENLQMVFYQEMSYSELRDWIYCIKSSAWDVVIILGIFTLGRLICTRWNWVEPLTTMKIIYMGFAGALIAVVIELIALKYDRWSYTDMMPLIPHIEVGIVPVLQLMILPFFTYVIVHKLFLRSREK